MRALLLTTLCATSAVLSRLAVLQRPTGVPAPPCFRSDSGRIAYGNLTISVDGDWSGVQFSFAVTDGTLHGWVVDARGGLPPERALDTIAVNSRRDSIYFSYHSATNTKYSYRMRVTCAWLQGKARLFQTRTDSGEVVSMRLKRTRSVYGP